MSTVLVVVAVIVAGLALQPRPPQRELGSGGEASPQPRRLPDRRSRQPAPTPTELAVWCEALARSIRAGATLHHALRSVAPPASIAGRFGVVNLTLARGSTVCQALEGVRPGSPHLDLVLVVLRACAQHGGAAAEPIDRAASALRQRAVLLAERRSQSAQARMSAVVMTVLPGAVLSLLIASSASVRGAIVSAPGVAVVVAGVLCNVAGWMWMRRLIGGIS